MDLIELFTKCCNESGAFAALSADPDADLSDAIADLDAIERQFIEAYNIGASSWQFGATPRRRRMEFAAATTCTACGHTAPTKETVVEMAPSRIAGFTSAVARFVGFRNAAYRVLEVPPFDLWREDVVVFNGWMFDGVDAVKLNKWRRREIDSPWGQDADVLFVMEV